MPVTITKRLLSGSADGQPIGITATQGATYNTIHIATSAGTGTIDEVYIYAHNGYTQTVELVLEFGISATTAVMVTPIPGRGGSTLVIPGFLILGSATAAVDIAAYVAGVNGGSASVAASNAWVNVTGFVNRLVQS